MLEEIAVSKNGKTVLVDMWRSHAATHFSSSPKLQSVVKTLIESIDLEEDVIDLDYDMGKEVGLCDLVATTDEDEIVYALRPNRHVYARLVKNRSAEPSSWITVRLVAIDKTAYRLHTAFVGKRTPSFPGGNFMPEQSREFWKKHALVWGNQEVDEGSITSECPWK